ncbi:hypothetical protein TOPH_06194, partial [Tolypocladium ophioglossoides CBS 100239]
RVCRIERDDNETIPCKTILRRGGSNRREGCALLLTSHRHFRTACRGFGSCLVPYGNSIAETTHNILLSPRLLLNYHYRFPSICERRGCPELNDGAHAMASSPRFASSQSRRTQYTKATTVSSWARRSWAYDDDFEQHLLDSCVFSKGYEHKDGRSTLEPTNLATVHQDLLTARSTLSPSRFPSLSRNSGLQMQEQDKSEGTVMRSLISIISGNTDIPNESHLPLTNLG